MLNGDVSSMVPAHVEKALKKKVMSLGDRDMPFRMRFVIKLCDRIVEFIRSKTEEWLMDILQLIDRLEELFNESKSIPLTRNVMVDEDRMLDIIDQMRIAIPEEVKKAQQLLGQRDRVLAQAQEEANRTLEIARQKADQLVTKDMVLQEAQRRADQLLTQARSEADSIRDDADDYVIESLNQLQAELERIANQVKTASGRWKRNKRGVLPRQRRFHSRWISKKYSCSK